MVIIKVTTDRIGRQMTLRGKLVEKAPEPLSDFATQCSLTPTPSLIFLFTNFSLKKPSMKWYIDVCEHCLHLFWKSVFVYVRNLLRIYMFWKSDAFIKYRGDIDIIIIYKLTCFLCILLHFVNILKRSNRLGRWGTKISQCMDFLFTKQMWLGMWTGKKFYSFCCLISTSVYYEHINNS